MSALQSSLEPLLAWLAAHPGWAGAVIGLIAFLESLAVVGLLVPGAALMFLAGAVVGGGNLAIMPVLLWAMAGAIAGDGLSYWLGRHFRDRLRDFPVIRRYPGALTQAERLFYRHGGKSVVIGRFVGPVRPVIPAVVGMLGMPPARFFIANVGSAVVWAPAYLLPGVVFGASLVLAVEVMGRLMAWLIVLFSLAFVLRWLIPRIDRPLRLAGHRLARQLGRQPALGWSRPWTYPLHVALRALRHRQGWLWWVCVLTALAAGLEAIGQPGLQGWERGLMSLADAQRSIAVQQVSLWLGGLGGVIPIVAATLVLGVLLGVQQQWQRARLGVAAVLITLVLVDLLNASVQGLSLGWPSYTAAIAALVTTWVCVLPVRRPMLRRGLISLGVLMVLGVGLSRWLLGVHGPLTILGSTGLGVMMGALPALATTQGRAQSHSAWPVLSSALVLVVAAFVVQGVGRPAALATHIEQSTPPTVEWQAWWQTGAGVAEQRLGLVGPAPKFAAQWQFADWPAVERLANWQPAPQWRWQSLLRWLSPQASMTRLPVLPRWHAGRRPAFVWIQPDPHPRARARWVLRAWRGGDTAHGAIALISLEREVIEPGVLLPRLRRHWPESTTENAVLSPLAESFSLVTQPASVPRWASPRAGLVR